jgi:hypothetical protein
LLLDLNPGAGRTGAPPTDTSDSTEEAPGETPPPEEAAVG